MFAFEVDYLLGRSFAGDFGDRSASEWPAHSGRLFSALAASYFESGASPVEKAALEWLERQAPPHLNAGEAGQGEAPVAYVPTNYQGDLPPVLRKKQPRYFPAQGPSEAQIYFIWPDAEPPADIAAALDDLAGRTGYLGKACSLVRMRVTDSAPAANYVPDAAGNIAMRVPSRGRLEELAWLYRADRQVTAGAQQLYRRTDQEAVAEAAETEFGPMTVFRRTAGPGLPIEAALTLTEAVRAAIMSNAGEGGPMEGLIHGHNGGTHCAIVALPFVGREHADGHLLGFAVVVPRAVAAKERRAVYGACAELGERGIHIPGVGDWVVEPVEETTMQHNLRAATWTRPARVWQTVTPILLDRFPKKNGASVEDILTRSCRRIGLPEPASIEHEPYSKLEGVPPVPAFRLRRAGDDRPRWGVHARIEFPWPVRGPVLLGAGRYFGLGLLRPEKEASGDES